MKIPELIKILNKYNQSADIVVQDEHLNNVNVQPEDIELVIDSTYGRPELIIKTKFVSKP